MAYCSSYYLYQRYEMRGGQEAIPSYPNVYSIDGEGSMPLRTRAMYDEDCGYIPDVQTIYRWNKAPSTQWECVGFDKHYIEYYQYSNDGGITWQNVEPVSSRTSSSVIEYNSQDCNYVPPTPQPEYRWTVITPTTDPSTYWCDNCPYGAMYRWNKAPVSDYECVGNDKHYKEYYQVSYDGGETWSNVVPTTSRASNDVIEYNSYDCGGPTPSSYYGQYLTFVALESGTFQFSKNSLYYSLDSGTTWSRLNKSTNSPTVQAGQKIMWKAELKPGEPFGEIGTFSSYARYNVEGNPMSLLYGDNFLNPIYFEDLEAPFENLFNSDIHLVSAANLAMPKIPNVNMTYRQMFSGCTSLTTPPQLPLTTLCPYCYDSMFAGCSGLTSVPDLPATTMAEFCYEGMFRNCTSLTSVPENLLPATTLARYCYASMFYGCTSLTNTPKLPANTMADSCYQNMFAKCRSLTTPPVLSATTLAERCYMSMFAGDEYSSSLSGSSLLSMPQLPATTLAEACYYGMFAGCVNLTGTTTLPATTLAAECYQNMFSGCRSMVTPPVVSATTITKRSCDSMFSRCWSLTATPQMNISTVLESGCCQSMFSQCSGLTTSRITLSADVLVPSCYASMFSQCSGLTSAPSLPATTLAKQCYQRMFENCTSLTTGPALLAIQMEEYCYAYMFSGCKNLTSVSQNKLPALSLARYCYYYMFNGCTHLVNAPDILSEETLVYTNHQGCFSRMFYESGVRYVKCLANPSSSSSYSSSWLYRASSSGTFVKKSTASWPTGIDGIPSNWTVQNV